MQVLAPKEIGELLQPYLGGGNSDMDLGEPELLGLCQKLSIHLELLLRWNERMNLTAIRDPREIVRRHFGESLFVARFISPAGSLLDLGSGAGFPGIPIQICRPALKVTLAESQRKKATFLREVVRELGLSCEIWAQRAEDLIPLRRFDAVVMRAVDHPKLAVQAGLELSLSDVWALGSSRSIQAVCGEVAVISVRHLPDCGDSGLFQLRRELFHVEQLPERVS